ncbi:Transposon Tf2-8 polyprotein [Vitis vinifera]|uniref:Transposon Tf2-8 polyprotein n=1 Tax=Vitis vinifera TaxID=29760 RepID=A0A438DJN0_VITVI|nr:Transposon Tf2-8 polyprotein [Vitis vinifera]
MPKSIISDQDPVFMSQFWQEFFKLSGTQLKMSSSYHPQTNGQSEVVNRCVEQYLCCYAHHQPRKRSFFLPWAEFWYNTTYHASIGMTPFQALYGRLPPNIPHYLMGTIPVHAVDQNLAFRDAILRQLKTNLHAATNRMKQVADSKQASQKLASRFYGPYQIEQRIGKPNNTTVELPLTDDEGEIVLEPKGILDTRWVKKGSRIFEESLVKWKQLPLYNATWEDTKMLRDRFINVNLEDKVPMQDRGIDEPRRSQRVPKKNPRNLGMPQTKEASLSASELMMLREAKLVGVGLITLLHFSFLSFCAASENQPCRPSSCGDNQNISIPFRLKGDLLGCGHPDPAYELVAEIEFCILALGVTVSKLISLKTNVEKRISLPSLPKVSILILLPSQPKPYWTTVIILRVLHHGGREGMRAERQFQLLIWKCAYRIAQNQKFTLNQRDSATSLPGGI